MIDLADRMKRYEQSGAPHLTRRVPVIVRVDGRAFHSLPLKKPFDHHFMVAMVKAITVAQRDMQGCRLAYTQSDEASFLLTDTRRLESESWFGYDLQKVVSIAAANMTSLMAQSLDLIVRRRGAFDGRAFNLPEDEVANYFLWRAKDWRRNSVQMAAQARFSPRQLHGVKVPEMLEALAAAEAAWDVLSDRERLGTFLLDGEELFVEPSYASISPLAARALEREEPEP